MPPCFSKVIRKPYETAFSRTGSFQPGLTKWQV
jgi:hypothetical protein